MITPENFIQWLLYAVERVGPGYYGKSERVYCYELYHFLRVAMYHHAKDGEPIDNIFLHSELVKIYPSEDDLVRWEIAPLDGRRSPDFLLHEPGSFEQQLIAMEVKTGPTLRYASFIDDIVKLDQIRTNFAYQTVIFHTIELPVGLLQDRARRAYKEGDLPKEPLTILLKENYGSKPIITNTQDILEL